MEIRAPPNFSIHLVYRIVIGDQIGMVNDLCISQQSSLCTYTVGKVHAHSRTLHVASKL